MGKNSASLKEFLRGQVSKFGVDQVKNQFGVTESTVNHWARGACLPRPHQMEKIVKLSRGRVSYAEMIETFNRLERARVSSIRKKSKSV